jgi:hypothetical protein
MALSPSGGAKSEAVDIKTALSEKALIWPCHPRFAALDHAAISCAHAIFGKLILPPPHLPQGKSTHMRMYARKREIGAYIYAHICVLESKSGKPGAIERGLNNKGVRQPFALVEITRCLLNETCRVTSCSGR